MGIKRLNHAVLYVSDVTGSAAFYRDVLGFRPKGDAASSRAVFTQAAHSDNDHDLALFSRNLGQQRSGPFSPRGETPGAHEPAAGLYHLAWEVDTLSELKRIRDQLAELGKLGMEEDHGVHKSVYGHDPDGLLFEVCWFVPEELQTAADREPADGQLDWTRELARFIVE
ncbi:VOC family protein [Chromobacterium sphagni]|uniref:Glyoxalase n=1 Tax=Chromobacterium sphagni TaxID=1903179 RepID=A0A1S1X146_9NEIS|nr:VOC family protein [Chromobacterium sphagni]OHX13058.1 glyoxalase [Chromobacterium sphagni]OHX19328.1 glyoxalase [Chromobacterium sphagni]